MTVCYCRSVLQGENKECVLECAVHESAEKHACGDECIYTTHSDREALVHHHAFGLSPISQS